MKQGKAILAAAAAAALLAAVAASAGRAYAESPVTFSGYLRLRTFALGGFFPADDHQGKRGDRYAVSRLRINVVFKPTDDVEVRWRFHGPHAARWGSTNTGAGGDYSLYSLYFYGVIRKPWGTLSVGRLAFDMDSAGFRTLGYLPTWGFNSQANVFERETETDGVLYQKDWDNGFGLRTFYAKRAHTRPDAFADRYVTDGDYDRYSIEPYYKWDGGGVSLAVQYDRNHYDFASNDRSTVTSAANPRDVDKNHFWTLNPAFVQKWDVGEGKTLAVHAEAKYSFGKRRRSPDPAVPGDDPPTVKQDGFGAYLDLALGYPQGDVTLAGWYFRGSDAYADPADDPRVNPADHSLVHGGEAFYPFILFNYGNNFLGGRAVSLEGYQTAGNWGVGLLGNHRLNEFVTLNWGVGTFGKTADYYLSPNRKASRALGTEIDLGLTVRILDGLQWQTKGAIFVPGGYYKDRYDRPDFKHNVWGWANEFLFEF
ncbi:MAG: porin [Deltaproteobacteria bacterium]|jgi:hypothetical protein|nr:porin [Deltaproteobacteria bacterium]